MDAGADINRNYKDSMFTALFREPERALELYNALSGGNYSMDTPVVMETLDSVFFLDRRNDLAFRLGDKLIVLIEQQSTVNRNMPLRLFLYLARVYEKIINGKDVYRSRLLRIPKPEFIVLYNGKDPCPARTVLRLSDAFEDSQKATGLDCLLEMELTVLNVHDKENAPLVGRSGYLSGYVEFVDRVRAYQSQGETVEGAILHAIEKCKTQGILAEFLESHSTEVFNVLTHEFNLEEAKEVWTEEALEEGKEMGKEMGKEIGKEMGKEIGKEEKALLIAVNMLREGFEERQVARITGLSVERVYELKSSKF